MNLRSLKEKVRIERYSAACVEARKAAPYTGKKAQFDLLKSQEAAMRDACQIVDDFSDEIWNSSMRLDEKLALMFELYEEMPSYHLLVEIWTNRGHDDEFVANYMLTRYRKYLSGTDKALARPAMYDLWCGLFEDHNKQEEAWHFLLKKPWNDQLIENLLEVSGPMTYELKKQLYDELLPDKKWHLPIARSIYFSIVDAYGNIDLTDAKKVFSKLEIHGNLDSENSDIIKFLRTRNPVR